MHLNSANPAEALRRGRRSPVLAEHTRTTRLHQGSWAQPRDSPNSSLLRRTSRLSDLWSIWKVPRFGLGHWCDWHTSHHPANRARGREPQSYSIPQCQLGAALAGWPGVAPGKEHIWHHDKECKRSPAFPPVVHQQIRAIGTNIVPCLHSKWHLPLPLA